MDMNGLSKKSNIQIPASDHAKLLKYFIRDFYSLPKTVYRVYHIETDKLNGSEG